MMAETDKPLSATLQPGAVSSSFHSQNINDKTGRHQFPGEDTLI
jgi:hypothetical protein